MGILSNNYLPCLPNNLHEYDFTTDPSQVYQGTASFKQLNDTVWGMVGGDANANGYINNADLGFWSGEAGEYFYTATDYNFDGQVENMDKELWEANLSYEIQVPE